MFYKELSHVIMEIDKNPESAVGRLENQGSWQCSHHSKTGRHEMQETIVTVWDQRQ